MVSNEGRISFEVSVLFDVGKLYDIALQHYRFYKRDSYTSMHNCFSFSNNSLYLMK